MKRIRGKMHALCCFCVQVESVCTVQQDANKLI
jgi:hypothetical protein